MAVTGPGGGAGARVLDPTLRARVRRDRAVVVAGLLVLGVAAVLAWIGSGTGRGYLDPTAPEPAGSRAVAEVLRGLGVQVVPVRSTAEATAAVTPQSTLLVTSTGLLNGRMLDRLARSAPAVLVLVEPDPRALAVLAPGTTLTGTAPVAVRAPDCPDPVAGRAGTALTGGLTFGTTEGGVGCYPADGSATVVRVAAAGGRPATVLLGAGAPLTNDRLADDGNAALALGLLGEQPRVVWWRPTAADPLLGPQDGGASAGDLVPGWVPYVLAQVLVAAAVLALWRGRRLGPVVSEPLPVVVRAAEATEGRARLYRRARARDRAAAALRSGTRDRLAGSLGLPRGSPPAAVLRAVGARTRRTPAEVAGLLYGPPPADDAALIRLADDLDALVLEVTRR